MINKYPYNTRYIYMESIDTAMKFNRPLEHILDSGNTKRSDSNTYSNSSVMLPLPIRVSLSLLKEERKLPMRYVTEESIKQGFSLIQYKYSKPLDIIKEARHELGYCEMDYINECLYHLKIDVNGVSNTSKKYISIEDGLLNGIRDIAHTLCIEQSSMIRLCFYFSFSTSYSISKKVTDKCKEEIDKFEKRLIQQLLILPTWVEVDLKFKDLMNNQISIEELCNK